MLQVYCLYKQQEKQGSRFNNNWANPFVNIGFALFLDAFSYLRTKSNTLGHVHNNFYKWNSFQTAVYCWVLSYRLAFGRLWIFNQRCLLTHNEFYKDMKEIRLPLFPEWRFIHLLHLSFLWQSFGCQLPFFSAWIDCGNLFLSPCVTPHKYGVSKY